MRDSLEALRISGVTFDHLKAIGGGTASRYWVRLIATVLDIPLALPSSGEFGAALGAARLAISATTGASPQSIMVPPHIFETIDPEPSLSNSFEDAYHAFRATYPAIKSIQ